MEHNPYSAALAATTLDPRDLASKILGVIGETDYNTASTALSIAETMVGHMQRVKHDAWMKANSPATVI